MKPDARDLLQALDQSTAERTLVRAEETFCLEVIEGGVGLVSPVVRFTTFYIFDPWGG